jgi:uncharacterized protein
MTDQAFLETILSGIVLHPEHMRLVRSEDARGILFRIHLTKSDMPLVIGRAGQTIKATRWFLKVLAKDGPTISVILEEPNQTT